MRCMFLLNENRQQLFAYQKTLSVHQRPKLFDILLCCVFEITEKFFLSCFYVMSVFYFILICTYFYDTFCFQFAFVMFSNNIWIYINEFGH